MAAQELAAATRGVLRVNNELLADDEIAAHVEHELRSAGVPMDNVTVSVLLGQVNLRGLAPSPEVRERAVRIARATDGVESVQIL
jgi:osmotically-inducible protein OsmY